jgi:hypothetical protein
MFDDLKRYVGLADDCPPGDRTGRTGGDDLDEGPSHPYEGGPSGGQEDDPEDAPPRYCHRPPSPLVKRTVKIVIGTVLLAIGLVMFVTPGPALIVIPVALGILASEIPWLRRHLHALRVRIHEYRVRRKRQRRAALERQKSQ